MSTIYLVLAADVLVGLVCGWWAAMTMDTPYPFNAFGEWISGLAFVLFRPLFFGGIALIVLLSIGTALGDALGLVVSVGRD